MKGSYVLSQFHVFLEDLTPGPPAQSLRVSVAIMSVEVQLEKQGTRGVCVYVHAGIHAHVCVCMYILVGRMGGSM